MRRLHRSHKRYHLRSYGSAPSPTPSAPVIEDFSTAVTASNSTSLSVPVPTGLTAGELWLIIFLMDGQRTITVPAPLTIEDDNGGTTTPSADTYSRIADGTEVPAVFTWSGLEQALAWSIRISGHNGYDLATFNNQATTGPTTPNITPSFDDSLVIQCLVADDSNPGTLDITVVPGVPYTELGSEVRTGLGGGLTSRLVYNEEDNVLVTGGSWTQSNSRNSTGVSITIAPAL